MCQVLQPSKDRWYAVQRLSLSLAGNQPAVQSLAACS